MIGLKNSLLTFQGDLLIPLFPTGIKCHLKTPIKTGLKMTEKTGNLKDLGFSKRPKGFYS